MDGATGNVFAPGTPPLDFTVFGRAGVVGGGADGVAGTGVGSVGVGMVVRMGEATDGGDSLLSLSTTSSAAVMRAKEGMAARRESREPL